MVMLEIERNLPEGQYSKISACCIAIPKVYIYIFDNKICCISRRGDSEQSKHGGSNGADHGSPLENYMLCSSRLRSFLSMPHKMHYDIFSQVLHKSSC